MRGSGPARGLLTVDLYRKAPDMQHTTRRRPAVAVLAAFTLVLNPAMPLVTAATQAPAAPAAKPPAAQPAATKPAPATATAKPASATAAAPAVDGGWPRAGTLPGGAS